LLEELLGSAGDLEAEPEAVGTDDERSFPGLPAPSARFARNISESTDLDTEAEPPTPLAASPKQDLSVKPILVRSPNPLVLKPAADSAMQTPDAVETLEIPAHPESAIGNERFVPKVPAHVSGGMRGLSPVSPQLKTPQPDVSSQQPEQIGDRGDSPLIPSLPERNRGMRGLSPVSPNSNNSGGESPDGLIQAMIVPVHIAASPELHPQPANITPVTTLVSSEPLVAGNDKRIPEKLNLAEFGVTRFVYKSGVEPHLEPALQPAQLLQQMMRTPSPVREIKPVKAASGFDALLQDSSSPELSAGRSTLPAATAEVHSVRPVFEPPPPPPVVRSVSMDIGDPESQVRVVIRERNGSLNVQFASSNERLREDLQTAGPMLMRELQRNNPVGVTLDFSNFGSATESDSQPRSHSRAKKVLKSDAEFADVAETAYQSAPTSALKFL